MRPASSSTRLKRPLLPALVRDWGRWFWPNDAQGRLGDYTTTARVVLITAVAAVVGVVAAGVAWGLLRLIGFITNLAFFGRLDGAIPPIQGHTVSTPWVVVIPVLGGIVVGFMAKFGSEKIRGDGIPEAIESVLTRGSRVSPRIAILKPLSSAITIGTGGPFGAEGPIIMTGGAFGSTLAQLLRLTAAERKTLLVAGAAGGIAAVFGTPVAAIALGVEVLLFEFKPRSLIPVAVAASVAALLRWDWIGQAPLFSVPAHAAYIGFAGLGSALFVGLSAGCLAIVLTVAVYAFEDLYEKLPIHWMWWPALGAVVVGVAGIWFPSALGVGYSNIGEFLRGAGAWNFILAILVVKTAIWSIALASGTSGGTLAPIMMIGCAMGAAEAKFLPGLGPGFWPLVALGATLGGTFRAPLTGIILSLEVTHDVNAMLPTTVAVAMSFLVTVLVLRRSILTERVAARGYHLAAEYAVDPLEMVLVGEVMQSKFAVFPETATVRDLPRLVSTAELGQRLYPVVDSSGRLTGVIAHSRVSLAEAGPSSGGEPTLRELATVPVVAYADEPLRSAVFRMAEFSVTRLPVVDRQEPLRLIGMVALRDILMARARGLQEERDRERVLRIPLLRIPAASERAESAEC